MQDLNDKVTGSTLSAAEWNEVPSEIQNVIEALGIALSSGDLDQLGKAISGYSANGSFYTDSGSANAYVLTPIGNKESPPAYAEGMVSEFIAGNANTAAATANVGGLGVINIRLRGGIIIPAAGDILTTRPTRLIYRTSPSTHFELNKSGHSKLSVITVTDATFPSQLGTKSIKFIAVGGGGGGGGVDGQGAGTGAAAGGGGGGGIAILSTDDVQSTYNITIGALGAGGVSGNNDGSTGGTTSVVGGAVSISCLGGAGGAGDLGVSGASTAQGGVGGTSSGGDLDTDGGDGHSGRVSSGVSTSFGHGGSSYFGGGAKASSNTPGEDSFTFSAGGSGGNSSAVANNRAGGDGDAGVVIVEEFL